MLWFVEGSGGESHLCALSRSWLPERMGKTPWSVLMRLNDKLFDSSMSLAICCMDAFVSFPSEQFKIMDQFRPIEDVIRTSDDLHEVGIDHLDPVINGDHPVVDSSDSIVDIDHPVVDTGH